MRSLFDLAIDTTKQMTTSPPLFLIYITLPCLRLLHSFSPVSGICINMKVPCPSLTETYHQTSYDAISPTRHELSVANKTVVVTGGGRGLGPEIARAYAAAGASHIVLLGRTQTTLFTTAGLIEKEFATVLVSTHTVDIADEVAIGKTAAMVGKWDVLILNAGVIAEAHSVGESDPADWWRVFEVRVLPPPLSEGASEIAPTPPVVQVWDLRRFSVVSRPM